MTASGLRPRVDVCVCTFQRESVRDTIGSIARQTYGRANIRVVVADNNATDAARERIEAAGRAAGIELLYVHAPERNISIARNACVDAVAAERFAFIDDDEIADPTWLERLMAAMDRSGADVVFGPVDAVYVDPAPRWWRGAGLHDTRPAFLKNSELVTGYTCNVLIRAEAVGDLRFRLDYGRSGGEDTMFFHALHKNGRRFSYAEDARTTEVTAPGRLKLRWLLARSFLAGQLHMSMVLMDGRNPASVLFMSLCKLVYSLGFALVSLPRPARWRRHLMRAALHVGVFARFGGVREILRE